MCNLLYFKLSNVMRFRRKKYDDTFNGKMKKNGDGAGEARKCLGKAH